MQAIPVDVRRAGSGQSLQVDLVAAKVVARLMDSQFEVGGIRFGVDAIIGLVPGVGDLLSMGVGMFPIYLARKHKLGRTVVLRMFANLAVDFVGGAVPVAGDVFDVLFKANQKNIRLLEEAGRKKGLLPHTPSGSPPHAPI